VSEKKQDAEQAETERLTPGAGAPEIIGKVEEVLPANQFLVRLTDGRALRVMVARKARPIIVKVTPGDRVAVEPYPYDPTRGTILRKLR
jgi:translation initiation factor IF-1